MVIVVDDDSQIREALESLLKSAEMNSVAFSSAEDSLESGLLGKATCVITDVRLPGMHGLELQRRIKREHPNLHVIVITGHHDEQVRERAITEGALAFFYKPLNSNDLLHALQSVMPDSGRQT
jgi:FixJ family two-component response regulator